jgi:hypothetical protein
MKDFQIRTLLRQTEFLQYIADGESRIIPELKLPVAGARIDIAVFNHHLHGYEIKSASDTLYKLPSQLNAYSKVFDYLTIVTELKHHERILAFIPNWVGVIVYLDRDKWFEVIQPPSFNHNKDGFFIAQLLWHNELVEVLTDLAVPFAKRDRRWNLCKLIATKIEVLKLSELVRTKIKQRKEWRLEKTVE